MKTIKILLGIVIIAIGIFSPCIIYAIWVMDKIGKFSKRIRKRFKNIKKKWNY